MAQVDWQPGHGHDPQSKKLIERGVVKATIIPGSQKKRCRNCFGTGTVFGHKKTLIIGGRKCPVCKGACWVPSEFPCQ